MAISMEQVKELRERTGAAVLDCKKVLEQTGGDVDAALKLLRERGLEIAAKKTSREAREGRIETYVHPGNRVVAVVELNCETDFVGRNDEFVQLARDIAMQVAAMNPQYLRKEDVPADALQGAEVTSPEKYFEEVVLLEQPFVKQPNITIGQKIQDTIAKTGENIVVRRYARWEVGA
ncbi:MAG TPA: translation elongation factor Ts [Herpetosiphonaceae bacterium]|nr:translation elongation factor Ts [Herpetosiphonaceae bacterium]